MLSLRAAGMTTTMTWEDDLQLTLLAYFLVSEGLLHLSPWVQVGQRHHSLDRFRKLMLREVRSLTQGFMMDAGQETRFSDTSSSGNSENRDSTRSVSPFNLLKRISIAQLPKQLCLSHDSVQRSEAPRQFPEVNRYSRWCKRKMISHRLLHKSGQFDNTIYSMLMEDMLPACFLSSERHQRSSPAPRVKLSCYPLVSGGQALVREAD